MLLFERCASQYEINPYLFGHDHDSRLGGYLRRLIHIDNLTQSFTMSFMPIEIYIYQVSIGLVPLQTDICIRYT